MQSRSKRSVRGISRAKLAKAISFEGLESRLLMSTTYYVSPSGNDSNPGTINEPLKTIQRAADVLRNVHGPCSERDREVDCGHG